MNSHRLRTGLAGLALAAALTAVAGPAAADITLDSAPTPATAEAPAAPVADVASSLSAQASQSGLAQAVWFPILDGIIVPILNGMSSLSGSKCPAVGACQGNGDPGE